MTDKSRVASVLADQQRHFLTRMAEMPRRDEDVHYSNRFVAFLDILGFRGVMSEIAATTPNDLFHIIVDSYWFHSAGDTSDVQLISDSIIISSKDDEPSSFISIANTVNALRNSFLERGLLIRGAISYGLHFQKSGVSISPALIEAYELESKSAVYPRILCAKSALDRVMPAISANGQGRQGIVGPYGFHVLRDQLPKMDADNLTVVEFLPDTLEPYYLRTGHHHDPSYMPSAEQLKHIREVGPQVLSRWKEGLALARARCKTVQHREKFDYLARKWNLYIASFKEFSGSEKRRFVL